MQAELAPFALENLGCAGSESRLLDCPVHDPTQSIDREGDPRFFDYFAEYSNAGTCDPYRSNYARVACGRSVDGSATPTLTHTA